MSEDRYYLTTEWDSERKAYIAVISLGSPQEGDKNIVVCDVDTFTSLKVAQAWFKRQMKRRPWEDN
jgi:hypothetical protein